MVCEHTQEIDLKRKKNNSLSGTTMMKHTEMFSRREYTTKNTSQLTKTRTARKIQLTFKINHRQCRSQDFSEGEVIVMTQF